MPSEILKISPSICPIKSVIKVNNRIKNILMSKTLKIKVQNVDISITTIEDEDYISLTDMVQAKDGDSRAADVIKNWIRNRNTIEFLGTCESLYNPHFKVVEFDHYIGRN